MLHRSPYLSLELELQMLKKRRRSRWAVELHAASLHRRCQEEEEHELATLAKELTTWFCLIQSQE